MLTFYSGNGPDDRSAAASPLLCVQYLFILSTNIVAVTRATSSVCLYSLSNSHNSTSLQTCCVMYDEHKYMLTRHSCMPWHDVSQPPSSSLVNLFDSVRTSFGNIPNNKRMSL